MPAPPTAEYDEEVELEPLPDAPMRRSLLSVHPYASDSTGSQPAPLSQSPVDRWKGAEELLGLCLSAIEAEKESPRLGRLHYEAARVLEYPLGRLDDAVEHYREARRRLPDHVPTVVGLRRVLLLQERHKDALELYDIEVKLTGEAALKAGLLFAKGQLLEQKLGRRVEARAAYEAARELAPGDTSILTAVARCQRVDEAWKELDATLARLIETTQNDAARKATLIEQRARLTEVRGGDPELATELYQQAFETEPRTTSAFQGLERLHDEHRRYRDLVNALVEQCSLAVDPELRASILYKIGRLRAERLSDLAGAAEALESAWQQQPENLLFLEELVRVYERSNNPSAVASVLERMVQLEHDPFLRLDRVQRIGQIAESDLKDDVRAMEWYERALNLDPTHLPILQALSKLYARSARWQELVVLHLREAEGTQDPLRRAAAHARVAEIFELHLGSIDQAMVHHGRSLGLVPGYDPSFRALSRLYTSTGRWVELVDLYERAVELAADEETKFTYLFKIGRIHEDCLGNAGAALEAYGRILAMDKRHLGAVHAMQRAAERAGEYAALVKALVHESSLVSDARRQVALLHRAGEVSEELLRSDDAALSHYRSVLEIDPSYAPVLTSLGRIHYRAGRWEELLGIYQKELEIASGREAKSRILHRMGVLAEEHCGRETQALAYYRRAVDADPKNTAARDAFLRKLEETGGFKELAQILEKQIESVEEPDSKARLALRLGEVYEHRLEQLDEARAAYEAALVAKPGLRPAREGRMRLLARGRSFRELALALADEAGATSDPLVAVGARLRSAEVYRDELNDLDSAIASYESVLGQGGGQTAALAALEDLYRAAGRDEDLARVLASQVKMFTDPMAQVAALREASRVQSGNAPQVRAIASAILERLPGDRQALEAAERAALAQSDDQGLAEADARLCEAGHEGAAAAHFVRLGEFFEPTNTVRALERYREALRRDAESLAAARGISRIAAAVGDPELLSEAAEGEVRVTRDVARAAQLLHHAALFHRGQGNTEASVVALERALEVCPDFVPAAKSLLDQLRPLGQQERLILVLSRAAQQAKARDSAARHWMAVAALRAEDQNDIAGGLAALGRVEKEQPNNVPVLLELADLYCQDNQWRPAVVRLEKVLASQPDDDVLVAASLRLAEVLQERLSDNDAARRALAAVLERRPNQIEALERLLTIELSDKSQGAEETARRLAEASTDRATQARAWGVWARLRRDAGAPDQACEGFERAIRLEGLSGSAGSDLKKILVEQKLTGGTPDWSGYANALSVFTRESGAPEQALSAAYLELGRILDDELRDPAGAARMLTTGLEACPSDPTLRVELATRLRRAGNFDAALQNLRVLLDKDPLRVETWRDLVEVFDGMGRTAESQLAVGPLILLNGANELQSSMWAARKARSAEIHENAFDENVVSSFEELSASGPASYLLTQISDLMGKIFSPDLERFGVSARERASARSGHPFRMVSDRVARIFDAPEYDLYPADNYGGTMTVVFTDPVGIIVPSWFAGLSEVDQVFLMGRVLCNLARRLHSVDALSDDDLGYLLIGAGRMVDGSFGSHQVDEVLADNVSRRVSKSIPWLGRGRVEDAAKAFVQGGPFDPKEYARGVRASAARAASLVADDIRSSVTIVRRLDGDQSGRSPEEQREGTALVRDLMRYWVSEPAMAARRQLRLV